MTIAAATKVARALASGDYGYDQSGRWSALADNGKLGVAGLAKRGEADCSSSTGMIYYLGSLVTRDALKGTFYTGNLASRLRGTGMFTVTSVDGWSLAKIKATLRQGDALLGPGHVVYCVSAGKVLSFESDERGRSAGGRVGDQTGREGRIRALYARSKGWAHLIRPISAATFQRRILAAKGSGKGYATDMDRLILRAPWDGPRWAAFMALWSEWDKGMALAYDPVALPVPDARHAYVVLGSALTKIGGLTTKMIRRLALAKQALDANPASVVVVSGGAPRMGMTEAAAGRAWLLSAGIDSARIITEARAASTVGNARYTLPVLRDRKLTSYTLVSDASHLRRASILFAAATLQLETAANRELSIAQGVPLAFDDYSPDPVKSSAPVTATTRATVAAEVASLLGLS